MKKNLETSVFEALHALCDGKRNQEEVAKSLHVSQSYLNRLLNRKRPVSGMTLDSVQKMFPHATLNLHGDVSLSQTGTNNGVVGVNNGTVNNAASGTPAKTAEAFRHEVIDALIGLDIPDEALQLVLKAIRDLET